MRRRPPRPAADAMMLLSSIYPRIDRAAGKVGSGFTAMVGRPRAASRTGPARGQAGAARLCRRCVVLRSRAPFLESGQTRIRPARGVAAKRHRVASVIPGQKTAQQPIVIPMSDLRQKLA
ncbi:hypothetical protein, partial [Burkholderia multivorans]|uniref:hypothetical protein n=1 Tax=Burkholderia multivorans TaxID=87883 RepID=UPI00286FC86B